MHKLSNAITNYKFSVLMPVCNKEKSEYIKIALDSILNQTLMPNEIIIAVDEQLKEELKQVIEFYISKYPIIKVVDLGRNLGIGKVRALGVNQCKYDIIALMDSDDISRNDRFAQQISIMKSTPDLDVIGSFITEFDETPENIYSQRQVPVTQEEIYKFAKFRMPVNNNTIMFKKKSVVDAGNFLDWKEFEDYELYGRMLNLGYNFLNIPDNLVNMRSGRNMLVRRGGIKNFINYEYKCFKFFLSSGFITKKEFFKAISSKFFLRIIPNRMKNLIYKKFLRSNLSYEK